MAIALIYRRSRRDNDHLEALIFQGFSLFALQYKPPLSESAGL
jgi:hypothetical protein